MSGVKCVMQGTTGPGASSGHAVHVYMPYAAGRPSATRFVSVLCVTGAVASCAARCGAGVRWATLDLAWEFGSPGHVGVGAALRKQPAFFHSSCGGAAAAAGGGGKAMRRLTDVDPPGP
jgi:hypothetical protein